MQPLLIYLRWGISADSEAPCYSNSLSDRVSSSSVTESRQKGKVDQPYLCALALCPGSPPRLGHRGALSGFRYAVLQLLIRYLLCTWCHQCARTDSSPQFTLPAFRLIRVLVLFICVSASVFEAPASPSLPSGESCVKQGATLPGPPELEQEAATAVSSPSLEKSCELADHRVTSILSLWFWGPEAVFPALLLGMKSCGSHTPTFNCIPEGDVHIQKDCLPAGCCPGEWHVPHAASRMWGEVGSSGGPQDQDRAQDQSSSWPHVLSTGRGSILVSLLTVGLRGSARRRLTLQVALLLSPNSASQAASSAAHLCG
uniref:Uncharacterized protein n=1 Tax=Rangifer tarandus platyrhynchus TaxID=3082113 RepID=A0ACB0F8T1_RANTA|nr:unnamed protein product [Rangifer tarandus platyrhynchus]